LSADKSDGTLPPSVQGDEKFLKFLGLATIALFVSFVAVTVVRLPVGWKPGPLETSWSVAGGMFGLSLLAYLEMVGRRLYGAKEGLGTGWQW
jgi:hypothetical protein